MYKSREELSYDLQFWLYFLCGYNSNIADEEATELRFYIDEPTFTDLHWVTSILCGNCRIFCLLMLMYTWTVKSKFCQLISIRSLCVVLWTCKYI